MPKPLTVGVAVVTAWKVLAGLSTSVSVSVPLAVGVPVPLLTPPASVTVPPMVPEITAASLAPLMVIVTVCASAVEGENNETVGQRAAVIERLHRRIVIVERVGPGAACGVDRIAAIAVDARRARRNRLETVGRIIDISIGQCAAEGRQSPEHRCKRRPLPSPRPSSSPQTTAASLAPLMVIEALAVALPPKPSSTV